MESANRNQSIQRRSERANPDPCHKRKAVDSAQIKAKEKKAMEIKSTLRVFNEADVHPVPGVTQGLMLKQLAGNAEHPSERMTVRLASFAPGTYENLHWHLIEAFYYVISGRAVVNDIEGKSHEMKPGSVIYAPPGLAGSHSWRVEEQMQLISFRAIVDEARTIQFDVDPSTKESSVPISHLARKQALHFPSLY
jgi:quercetin dioxygenase-like cupin family protein